MAQPLAGNCLAAVLAVVIALGTGGSASAVESTPLRSGTTTSPAGKTSVVNQSAGVNVQQVTGLAKISDGQIAKVRIATGQGVRTGSTVKIEWDWPGYVNHPADVTLWQGPRPDALVQVGTIVTERTQLYTNWLVPYTLAPGNYRIRVASSRNPDNRADLAILVLETAITVTSPNSKFTMAKGSTYSIWWTYQGSPGPVKIELTTTQGNNPILIANNVPCGNLGSGKFDWQVFDTLATAGNYVVTITSLASARIKGSSQPFSVAPPSITILKPKPGERCLPGVYIPIAWRVVGKLGDKVRVTATPVDGNGTPLPWTGLDIEGKTGSNNDGAYDRWMPTPTQATQAFIIRVESVQFPMINADLKPPMYVLPQQSQAAPPAEQTKAAAGSGISG
jgi:hypothetical protein